MSPSFKPTAYNRAPSQKTMQNLSFVFFFKSCLILLSIGLKYVISEGYTGVGMDGDGRKPHQPTAETTIGKILPSLQITDGLSCSKATRRNTRRVWEKIHRRKIPQNCCIHHRDLNHNNDSGENLLLLPVALHLELHARLRRIQRTTSKAGFEVERYYITQEYERRGSELIAIWELIEPPPTEYE